MNAIALPTTRTTPRRGLTARRWLIVLLAFEGVVALCAAVAFALSAPTAENMLGGSLGSQSAAAALLLAGLSGVLAFAAFHVTGALLRDRQMAEASAAGVQATILGGATIGLVGAGMLPALAATAGLAAVGLLLVLLSLGSARR
ncbi:MAG: hypothetical protein ABI622_00045 [Chloroflexota bacterium]